MNSSPSDPGTPRDEDAALAAALSKRVAIPPAVLARLRAERTQTGAKTAEADKIVAFPFGSSATAHAGRTKGRAWPWMAAAAAIAVAGLVGYQMWPRDPAAIVTRSPQGTVTTTQPEIAWENAPGKNYNVWILPAEGDYTTAPALFVAKGVRSPVPFSALKPGKDLPADKRSLDPEKEYRVLVCYNDTGSTGPGERIAGTPVPFRVAPAANPPPARP
jgi:hypothetical protein